MERRRLGRTELEVSVLGFGCGNVGGLMVRGSPADRERAVARAVALGINYFDTAPSYGDGLSEQHLGQALRAVAAPVHVGTKFRLDPSDLDDIPGAIGRSLEASLRRLRMERVDLFQLHNPILPATRGGGLALPAVLEQVIPALAALQQQGKIGFYGITALGDTATLHRVVDAGGLHTAQVVVNLLNPSAAGAVPPGFPAQDFDNLLARTRERDLGVIAIRVLAAGALSGATARHPIAVPSVDPIASGPDYATDVARTDLLAVLVAGGFAGSLVEAALRFTLSADGVSTILVGYSGLEDLEAAAEAIAKGPLSPAARNQLAALWAGLARS